MTALTASQLALLRNIDTGTVLHSSLCRDADGVLHRDVVLRAAHAVQQRGLAEPGPVITEGHRAGDRVWRLTVDGRLALANHASKDKDR